MSQQPPGFRWATFGDPSSRVETASQVRERFRTEWEQLSARVHPSSYRPDHALTHFSRFRLELDRWTRDWGARAEKAQDQQLRQTVSEAQSSLLGLLEDAKELFQQHQRAQLPLQSDPHSSQAGFRQAQREADRRREQALAQQKLEQTHQEIQAIYDNIRANNRRSHERSHATWMAASFPDTTCACGKGKMFNQPCCWDCAQRGRSCWY